MTIQYNAINNEWDQISHFKELDSYTRFPEDWDVLIIPKDKFWEMPNLVLASKLQNNTKKQLNIFVKFMRDPLWQSCQVFRFEYTLATRQILVTGYIGELPMIRHIFKQ